MNKPIHPNFFIPETFGDAVSYEVQVKYLHQRLKDLEEEGIPTPDLTELKQRVTTLETEVSAIQGEIEDLDLESITAQFEQINADIEQLQATQSQQGTTIQGYNTRILELETKADSQDQAIDALDGRVTGVTTAVSNVVAEQTQMAQDIAGKQDQLTAGANITIQNNVISASGGGGTIDIDTTVTPNSQHAVTSEGIYTAIQTAKTAVETQHTTDINRIDGELAGKASTTSVTTLRGDMEDEIERVEGDYQDADTALDTRLTAVETAQTTTEGNVTTLQQNVTTLQQTQTSQGTAIQGIRGRLDTAESNITQLQTNTSTLSGDVSSLQQTVSGKQDQLTAGTNITIQNNVISASGGGGSVTLDNDVTQNSQNGVKSSGIYTAIETAKSGLQESITDIDGRVDTLEADNTTNKSNISTLQSSVASAQDDIGTLQTGLQQEASDRETADQALRVSINGNTSAINTLRTNTNASITQLQTDVAGKQDQLTAGQNITIQNNVISASGGGGSSASVVRVDSESDYRTQKDNTTSALAVKDVFSNSGMVSVTRTPAGVINSDHAQFVVPCWDSSEGPTFYRENADIYVINRKQDEYQLKNGRGFTTTVGLNNHSVAISPNWDAPWIAIINNESQRVSPPSMSMSNVPDNQRICRHIPVTTRVTDSLYTENIPRETYYNWFNINGRVMRGYAVYQADLSGRYSRNLLGIMWVDRSAAYSPSYEQSGDLISCNYECTIWDHIADVDSSEDRNAIVIVPIF